MDKIRQEEREEAPEAPSERKGAVRQHDPEVTERLGMSSEAAAADEQETMASTGNSEAAFVEIVTGTATGLGIDRGEAIGTGGLAAGEDLDPVAEGDWWRENFRRDPYEEASAPYERSLEPFLDRPEPDVDEPGDETNASDSDGEGADNKE